MTADCGLRDLPLLDAVIADIKADPRAWEQKAYRCETGMCIAGLTAEKAGGAWAFPATSSYAHYLLPEPGEVADAALLERVSDTWVVAAPGRAARLLGLKGAEASDLFHVENTLRDIRGVRDQIAARMAAERAA
jgi:hypothetical protein